MLLKKLLYMFSKVVFSNTFIIPVLIKQNVWISSHESVQMSLDIKIKNIIKI